MRLIYLLIICMCFAIASCAQAEPSIKQDKFAVVNSSVFYNERGGIIPLVLAVKPLYSEFEPKETEIKQLVQKQRELSSEISKHQPEKDVPLTVAKETENKIKELENLNCKIISKSEEAKFLFEKRRQELTKELRADIAQSIKQFAKERGYNIVVINNSQEFVFEDSVDVTMEFIKFYHMSPKKNKSQ